MTTLSEIKSMRIHFSNYAFASISMPIFDMIITTELIFYRIHSFFNIIKLHKAKFNICKSNKYISILFNIVCLTVIFSDIT